ncbi:uncharacterized protein N7443_006035 [Penicillium atrosanguineum]|uniref:uncharacterized protein n=1 Tax=Penicillium atrosanguineum TaxID=1132637 RepID=UPI00238945AC|nr:uncharacterized protein N7443_006035 [Penicillium atrosanguineum]KAJ5301033.1 hypothetical protein N7443_006035 [Penicillium atrosanguineum]
MPPLNVIALISGGKDSFYSILHCLRNGHRIIALANLHPEPDLSSENEEDIDSFMYQTIGHSVIPLYAEALGLPLYRAPITGGAVDTARIYRHDDADQGAETTVQDETECLVPLLRRVMEMHPEANAVSAGAILSTYQRTRIENVAGRLGLVPLAWLWMYPSLPASAERDSDSLAVKEAGLLEDMAGCGCDARIIKVASGGLDDGFLWESVSGSGNAGRGVRKRIVKGMGRFAAKEDIRGAVLGEGGEYETLAIDGPGFLWKKRIEIEEREVGTGEGGVAFMKLKDARCVDKEGDEIRPEDVRTPALLDEVFVKALEGVPDVSTGDDTRTLMASPAWSICKPHHRQSNQTWSISNLVAPEAGPGASEQMDGIVKKTEAALKTISESTPRSTEDIVFATVLLRSMDDFALMNNVYVSLFKKPNPPARVTVACGDALPSNVRVMVSFVVDMGARNSRQGLHVQSRSYWAPANIGPYSQAMSIPLQGSRVIYIAGQIPLEPASMEIATTGKSWFENYCLRAVLSLQHLWRIGDAMQVDWWLGGVAFLTGEANNIETQVKIAWYLWKKMHTRAESDDSDDEDPQLDAWDIKYGRRAEELMPESDASTLPNFSVLDEDAPSISPFLAVEVDQLPRGSDIEWQGLGSRCEQAAIENKTEYICATVDERYRYLSLEVQSSPEPLESSLRDIMATHCQNKSLAQAVLYTTQPVTEGLWDGQVVPCRSVWGREGQRLTAGIVLQEELA